MKRIGIIGGGLAPLFNEAMANQINLLSKHLNLPVITCNDIGSVPFMKYNQYIIFNSKYIIRRTPILSLINSSVLFLATKYYEKVFDCIILPGGIESEFLKYLDLRKCIPLVSSIHQLNDAIRIKMQFSLSQFPLIIAQSERAKDRLIELGANPECIFLMYPLVDFTRFHYSNPPDMKEFRILFASAPNMNVHGEDNFNDKGVPLLLEAFKELLKCIPNSKLYLVWRGYYTHRLIKMLNELELENSVQILFGIADMPSLYKNSHITVIPYMNLNRSPDIPLSALESLSCGRPVVASNIGEIADILTSQQVGVVSTTTVEDFCQALCKCRQGYFNLQKNCKNFNIPKNIPFKGMIDQNFNR